jgi:hypothetical protein
MIVEGLFPSLRAISQSRVVTHLFHLVFVVSGTLTTATRNLTAKHGYI